MADNIQLKVLDNKKATNLPDYSEIFIKRCEEHHLTPREKELMYYKTQALSDKLTADKLCIQPYTVNTHLKNIFEKLRVHCIAEAIFKVTH